MRKRSTDRPAKIGIAVTASCALLVGACAPRQDTPAPVYINGSAQTAPAAPTSSPSRVAGRPTGTRYVLVEPGQSLVRIAQAYHVPKEAIITANRLSPPYELKAGSRLVIPPASMGPIVEQASPAKPALSVPPASDPRRVNASSRQARGRHKQPEVIPLDDPAPAAPSVARSQAKPMTSEATSAPWLSPSPVEPDPQEDRRPPPRAAGGASSQ